jgi:hypothetical protein
MMVVTATLAVSFFMFLGIASLVVYREGVRSEEYFRESAAVLKVRGEAAHAAEWQEMADEMARQRRHELSYSVTTLGLVELGIVLAGIGTALRVRFGPRGSARPGWTDALCSACSTGAMVLLIGFAIGGIAYVGILLLVLVGND